MLRLEVNVHWSVSVRGCPSGFVHGDWLYIRWYASSDTRYSSSTTFSSPICTASFTYPLCLRRLKREVGVGFLQVIDLWGIVASWTAHRVWLVCGETRVARQEPSVMMRACRIYQPFSQFSHAACRLLQRRRYGDPRRPRGLSSSHRNNVLPVEVDDVRS